MTSRCKLVAMTTTQNVQEHYTRPDLHNVILGALKNAGKDPAALSVEDTAPLDEFHMRGRQGTLEMTELLNPSAEHHLLDVGCGIGGPARFIASQRKCKVTGIDLTEQFIEVANSLAKATHLDQLVDFQVGDATSLGFAPGTFDGAFTEHVLMNIAEKSKVYQEVRRVLKAGARFAMYDVLQGNGETLTFPVPWAHDASTSFLATPGDTRKMIVDAGFREVVWRDVTGAGLEWLTAIANKNKGIQEPAPLGLHVVVGPAWSLRVANLGKNFQEKKLQLAMGLFEAI